jgi:hypothetical protein
MKLADLRATLRPSDDAPQPEHRQRDCTICLWTEEHTPAKYVMTGEARKLDTAPGPQWFDCGEHPDEPNGKVIDRMSIPEWHRIVDAAMLRHEFRR